MNKWAKSHGGISAVKKLKETTFLLIGATQPISHLHNRIAVVIGRWPSQKSSNSVVDFCCAVWKAPEKQTYGNSGFSTSTQLLLKFGNAQRRTFEGKHFPKRDQNASVRMR